MKLSTRLLCLEFDQLESKKAKLREMFQTGVWKYLKFDVQLYSVNFNFLKLFEHTRQAIIQLLRSVTYMFIECVKSIHEKNYWK